MGAGSELVLVLQFAKLFARHSSRTSYTRVSVDMALAGDDHDDDGDDEDDEV